MLVFKKTLAWSKKFLTRSAADAVAIWHVTVTVWYSRERTLDHRFSLAGGASVFGYASSSGQLAACLQSVVLDGVLTEVGLTA